MSDSGKTVPSVDARQGDTSYSVLEHSKAELSLLNSEQSIRERPLDKHFFYLAGGLFNNADLTGNLLIGGEIYHRSGRRYVPDFPQDLESNTDPALRSSATIRANDLRAVFVSDYGVFMKEGMEMDSGMVVEFAFAKALGIPSVQIRTDFRKAGDQFGEVPHPWNLMLSDFPNSEVVLSNSMLEYGKAKRKDHATPASIISELYGNVAQQILDAMVKLENSRPVIEGTHEFLRRYFVQLVESFDGSGELRHKIDDDVVEYVVQRRITKGTLRLSS